MGEHDERLPLAFPRRAVRHEVAERAADARVEVGDPRLRERDPERVAARAREVVLLVAAERDGPVRDRCGLGREPRDQARPLLRGDGLPRRRAVGPGGEEEEDDDGQDADRAKGPAARRRLRSGRRRHPVDSLLVLDELAEAEVRVLGPWRRSAAGRAARLGAVPGGRTRAPSRPGRRTAARTAPSPAARRRTATRARSRGRPAARRAARGRGRSHRNGTSWAAGLESRPCPRP